ncbi:MULTISPECIES: thiamine-phosphate kinase [unclassified Archaeoglobus]|jgi:thiamine-monophosphate kinase|uniref:thiamine-phosphate kinase n=1 Tax=unclassified Archaeoglobus TaxID=2643606 RepID=UPI0025B960CB|nr:MULTISPECIES: thiamine-phosphate kinase [unclassified Archaeoglobus]
MREFDMLKIVEEFFGDEDVEVSAGRHDASYVRIGDRLIVLSCDTVNEKSDFPPSMLPEEMGHMAVAVTLSDLAACGAKPLYFLSSISLKRADYELFTKLLRGIKRLASKFGVKVVGGDIDFSDILTIVGFAVGEADRVVTRRGAKPGDNVYVTNPPGKAEVCLEMLRRGAKRKELPYPESLYTPEPRIEEGRRIARYCSAMTDISDSLAISSHLIARSSGVRIVLDSIPLKHLEGYAEDPLEVALYGGGDFELLFTAEKSDDGIRIGRVEDGEGVFLEANGKLEEVEFRGYSHF